MSTPIITNQIIVVAPVNNIHYCEFKGLGIQGIKGDKGEQGDIGPAGAGEQGLQGIQGIQGEQGLQGDQGLQGLQGEQGIQGEQGEQGIQGSQGEQGIQGEQGDAGTNGTNGTNGEGVPVGGTTGQVLAKINATDFNTEWVDQSGGGGGDVISIHTVPVLLPQNNDVWMSNANTGVLNTNALSINQLRMSPFLSPYTFEANQVAVNASAVTAGVSVGRVVIYEANADTGMPTSLPVLVSSEMVLVTNNNNIATINFTFLKNKLYWIGVWNGGASTTYRVLQNTNAVSLGWGNGGFPQLRVSISYSPAYHSSNDPSVNIFDVSNFSNALPPIILMRRAFI